jgi:predicted DNA-binding transcriptional regulator YafY
VRGRGSEGACAASCRSRAARPRSGPGGGYVFDARAVLQQTRFTAGEAAALIVALVDAGPRGNTAGRAALEKLISALTSQ